MNKSIAAAVVAGCHDFTTKVRRNLKAIAALLTVNPITKALTVKAELPFAVTYGPELVKDTSLDTIAGWTLGAGWAHTGGNLVWTPSNPIYTGSTVAAYALPTLEAGCDYYIEIDGSHSANSTYYLIPNVMLATTIADPFSGARPYPVLVFGTASERFSFVLTARATEVMLLIRPQNNISAPVETISYVSVRKIINNAARFDLTTTDGPSPLRMSQVGISLGMGAGVSRTHVDNPDVAIGAGALGAVTSPAYGNVAIGRQALAQAKTNVYGNIAIGDSALASASGVSNNIAIGTFCLSYLRTGSSNLVMGLNAAYRAADNTALRSLSNSILLGYNNRPLANGDTNEIIIGTGVFGNGSNTATWGGPAITNNFFGGNLNVAGSTLGLRTAKTPATAADPGTAGDICWDASYVYVCVAANTWKRSPLATW